MDAFVIDLIMCIDDDVGFFAVIPLRDSSLMIAFNCNSMVRKLEGVILL